MNCYSKHTLQKHAYTSTLPNFDQKWKFKKLKDILHTSVQNIDCWDSIESPRQGSSIEYPQSMLFNMYFM